MLVEVSAAKTPTWRVVPKEIAHLLPQSGLNGRSTDPELRRALRKRLVEDGAEPSSVIGPIDVTDAERAAVEVDGKDRSRAFAAWKRWGFTPEDYVNWHDAHRAPNHVAYLISRIGVEAVEYPLINDALNSAVPRRAYVTTKRHLVTERAGLTYVTYRDSVPSDSIHVRRTVALEWMLQHRKVGEVEDVATCISHRVSSEDVERHGASRLAALLRDGATPQWAITYLRSQR